MGRKPLWLAGLALVLVGCDDTFVPVLPPCTSSGTPLTLAVAQYRSLDPFLGSGCTLFPASGAGSVEYLLVPQSASSTPNDSQGFKLQGAAAALAALAPQLVVPEAPPAELSPAERFHLFLRQAERTRAYGTPPPQAAPSALAAPQVPATITPVDSGSQRTFKVCGNLQCTTPLPTVTATAKKVGQHIAIYVDNAAPANGLSQADLDALRDVFDNQLYAVDRGAFGAESDIDSNAVVIVLMTNKVNQLVPKADCQPKGFVAGYFFGADIDPVFRTSYNNAEIFYSIVADTGALSCAHTVSAVKNIVPVTFVHEFQHMISYNQHVLLRGGAAEVLWLNEAMSHYAEERGGRSFLPTDSLSFCQFVKGDLFNAAAYDTAPGKRFLVDTAGIGGLEARGAYWLFLRYLIDQYALDTSLAQADAFTRTLVNTAATGVANVVQRANNTAFATLVSRWTLSNYVSDLPGFTAPPELRYKTWAFRSAYPLFNQKCTTALPAVFPLSPGSGQGSAVNLSGVLRAGSGTYFRAQQGAGAAGFTLLFTSSSGTALRSSVVPRLNVIRIQ